MSVEQGRVIYMTEMNGEQLLIQKCDTAWMALMGDPTHLFHSAMIGSGAGKGIRSVMM